MDKVILMHVLAHIPVNFTIGYLFYMIIGQPADIGFLLAISAAGFLIDIDHAITFIMAKRSIHPTKFYRWLRYQLDHSVPSFYICHTFEFIAFLYILSFSYSFAYAMFIGYALHLATDMTVNIRKDIIKGESSINRFKYWSGTYFLLYPGYNYMKVKLSGPVTTSV
ncbi:MAG: hypothetical protein KAR51_00435 [Candidatus Aenigmarchaeota archaeon]|nr:hypothetical protein [Candidatus Aenigmarchaeota archaeon]